MALVQSKRQRRGHHVGQQQHMLAGNKKSIASVSGKSGLGGASGDIPLKSKQEEKLNALEEKYAKVLAR